ncbi:unnamed protein product [marine sediment metagenome]|uniref:Methyltransferase FkbM domain-containing protein n=1 Tax=marine sediment metagenome TaxID=412755 RepID=X1FKY3_9ZZZZ
MSLMSSIYQKLPKSVHSRTVNWYRFLPRSKKIVIHEIDGIRYELDLSRLVHSQMYHYGVWEPDTTNIINKYVRRGMVCLDIGASSGVHTLRMAKLVGKKGKVYAFEPSDWMFEKLMRNIELNRRYHGIIITEKIALFSFDRKGKFETTEHGKIGRPIDEPMIDMDFMCIDSYVKKMGIKKLDFVKIDTDGYEAEIFEGAEKTLKKYQPMMIVEFRPSLTKQLIDILSSYGYTFYRADTFQKYTEEELVKDIKKEVKNVLCR